MRTICTLLSLSLLCSCGGQKREESAVATPDFCSAIHMDQPAGLSAVDSLIKTNPGKTGVYVLEDGGGSMVARAWLCENAQHTIDVQYFIFSTDNVGLIAADTWYGLPTGV